VDFAPLSGLPAADFALLTAFPGYFFAPRGTLLVGPARDFPPVVGLLEAGTELERLIAGLRAVEGRAFGEGW
jgi:hypothetical protein